MMIIGCDFHPSWQQVSWLDTETGETGEQKLVQASGDAERFYRQVAAPALIGMEAAGNCHWLVDLLSELGHELWVGDAAQIRASYVRQQKTDKRDAAHILKLLVEGRFPRIWMPSSEVRDLRQLLLHRYKLVIMRARVKNELQHLCLNKGVQRKHKLWSQAGQQILRELPLKPWAGRRRDDTPRADGRSWARSPSRATACCACCWWKRRKPQFVTIPSFAKSICIAAIRSRRRWPRWQRRASWRYDCTGCCARNGRIQRSFASRVACGCPWSARARPKELIGRSRIP